MERRLAAIMAADVVGYSRLMEQDEMGTLAALKERRRSILNPLVAQHHGRIVKVIGDGVLVEFASAVNAVVCAVELQKRMAVANDECAEDRRIVLRIGINLGDVIVESGDLYGDGVIIAVRLEGISEAGGIMVSGTAYDHVKNKTNAGFEDLGTRTLKNIAEPLRVYRIAGTAAIVATASKSTADKPAIAVLAFVNMSGDPEQEYFSDGIAEDIITDLSKVSSLAVTARNTTFALKDKPLDIGQVARQLNATHVVEGSVRKVGNRVRISAQLIDGRSGHHIWAERYDRNLDDIFTLQDEISRAIVDALKVKLAPAESTNIGRRTTENAEAYQIYLMGRHYYQRRSRQNTRMAVDLYQRATEIDSNYAQAWAALALAHSRLKWTGSSDLSLEAIETFISRAMQLDGKVAEAYAAQSRVLFQRLKLEDAEAASRRAIELDSSLPDAHHSLGDVLRRTNRLEEAARAYEVAMSLDTYDYSSAFFAYDCYNRSGHSESPHHLLAEAVTRIEHAIALDPEDARAYAYGSFALLDLGQPDRAMQWAKRATEIDSHDYLSAYNVAGFFIQVGETDLCFNTLDRCMPHLGYQQLCWMKQDPDFDRIRDHPRYKTFVQEQEERWRSSSQDMD